MIQNAALMMSVYVRHHANRLWKNSNARLLGLLLLSYANYAYAQSANPFVAAVCNVVNLFSGQLITGITFIAAAVLLIVVMVSEARGVIGMILKVLICAVGLLALKSLITTVFGYSFGC